VVRTRPESFPVGWGSRSPGARRLPHGHRTRQPGRSPIEALELYAEALTLKEELGDRRQQAWILLRMGDVHLDERNFPLALQRYRRAIRIWEEIRDPRGVATGLEQAAVAEFKLGRYEESLELFRRAAEILAASQPAFLASVLAEMGEAYAATGDGVRALEHGRRAAELARRGRNDEVRWATARSLGWIERRLGHRENALISYRESIAIIETLRGRLVASSDVRAGFLEGKQAVYGETVELLIELGRFEEALEVAERSRARAFLDLLSGRDLVTKPADQAALERIASLQEALRREAILAPTAGPATLGDGDRGETLRSELTALTAARPELASLVTTPSLTIRQTRREARRGGTILEYFSANERLFIWVLAPDGSVRAASSQISRRELSVLVGAVRGSLGADALSRDEAAQRRAPRSSSAASDLHPLLRRLHRILIKPVSHLLPRDRDDLITIVPHGPLFLISFAALVDGKGQYFVERHTLAYSPSISVLRHTGRNRDRVVGSASPQLLVIGNPVMPKPPGRGQPLAPLPGAEREARTIAGFYPPARVNALTGSRARERTVRELAPGQTIIHLATHAVVFDDEPMSSYLALAPEVGSGSGARDPLGDGLLTVAEVFGLDLHADLVTLSACNTGLGRVSGDGVVGLSRAFIYAGTASVLVSLWGVADAVATKEMERFYRGLIRTAGNKAAAVAAAQREMIAQLRAGTLESPSGRALAEDPLLWAPFVLVGEAR
jgi:CHAT domain-containing protein